MQDQICWHLIGDFSHENFIIIAKGFLMNNPTIKITLTAQQGRVARKIGWSFTNPLLIAAPISMLLVWQVFFRSFQGPKSSLQNQLSQSCCQTRELGRCQMSNYVR